MAQMSAGNSVVGTLTMFAPTGQRAAPLMTAGRRIMIVSNNSANGTLWWTWRYWWLDDNVALSADHSEKK